MPIAGCGQVDLGWLVDWLVPSDMAAELGRAAFSEIVHTTPTVSDRNLQRRVQRVAERVIEASGTADRDWAVLVFDRPEPNAFALPGGKIGVYAGMLRVTETSSQLATVLGHEVGHVVARHAAQRLLAENAIELTEAAIGMALSSANLPVPPGLVASLGRDLVDLGVIRPFSRAQELDADALGLDYMARAGFRPSEALVFWRRMMALKGKDTPFAFLSTHPSDQERIARLDAKIQSLNES